MSSVIGVNVWRGFPFFGISFLAGMKAIPGELYEAAAVDGATVVQRFRYVTLPGIRNILMIVMLLSTIWTFNDFAIVYILTKGGPGGATMVLPVLTYEIAFGAQRLGEAIAVALYMLPPLAFVIIVLSNYMRKGQGEVSPFDGRARADTREGSAVIVRKGRSTVQIERTQSAVSYAILITFLLLVIFPFYWMIVTSFKGETQMRSLVSMFWPSPFVTENYEHLLSKTEFVSWYKNSIIVSVSSTFLATAIGTLGAYALARLKFLGRAFMASTVLITYLVPPSILFIPLYAQIRNLGMADSLTGLIAAYPSFTVPFVTWLLMGYFESIPVELEESAMIDGATRFGAFRRVILPLAAPGLLASGLYAFTQAWNEFLYALVFITNVKLRTLPVGLSTFITGDVYGWGFLMAGAVLTTLPVIAAYIYLQKYMVEGLTAGSVKG